MTSRARGYCLAVSISLFLLGSPSIVYAQSGADHPDAADAAAMFGYDPITGPLVFEAPPHLNADFVQKQASILTLKAHWREAGRLAETVAADNLRLEAGALLFRTSFRAGGLSSDVLPAWCGAGQGGWVRLKSTVCLIETPDGKAMLADGLVVPTDVQGSVPAYLVSEAPDWYVSAIRTDMSKTVVSRPRIDGVAASELPPLNITIDYFGAKGDSLLLLAYVGLRSDPASRRQMRRLFLHTDGSSAQLAVGGYNLKLAISDQGIQGHWERGSGASIALGAASTERPKPTPLVIDGALIDPRRLNAPTHTVHTGEDLLSGPASHWATAKAAGFGSIMFVTFQTPPSAVFHKIETVRADGLGARSISQAWCGPMVSLGLTGMFCVQIDADGRISAEAVREAGRKWMAEIAPPGAQSPATVELKQLDLSPSDQDLIGPMAFELRLDNSEKSFDVSAVLRQHDEAETIWLRSIPFQPDGTARVPFWSYQLVATKVAGGVTVRFDQAGDGTGPLELDTTKGD